MARARTLVEKIMARAAGLADVTPGDLITAKVDLAMIQDSGGPRRVGPLLDRLGAGVWDPDRVVVVSDHYVPAVDLESAAILKQSRDFVARHGIKHFYDMKGICHLILAEKGHVAPGFFAAGGDSHSTMGGAFGAYMAGYGATEMAGILATGETWTSVPETIRVTLEGALPPGVTAKDIMLLLCARLGLENSFKVVEYDGSTVAGLAMMERLVLSNMAAELGAETGLIAPDETTLDWLRAAGRPASDDALSWRSDPDASYCAQHRIDVAALTPMVAAPHSPANSGPLDDHAGTPVDQAYIGACVGAKLSDLRMAAQVLKGKTVASGTRLLIAPGSAQTTAAAAADGTLAILTAAGAILLPSGCGACAGMGAGIIAEGERCISTTNRNFKGRMGHKESFVYLASPYSVAAAAVTGRITDPRPMLSGTPEGGWQ